MNFIGRDWGVGRCPEVAHHLAFLQQANVACYLASAVNVMGHHKYGGALVRKLHNDCVELINGDWIETGGGFV